MYDKKAQIFTEYPLQSMIFDLSSQVCYFLKGKDLIITTEN